MTFDENVKRLVQYGIESGLVPEEERIYTTNQLLELFGGGRIYRAGDRVQRCGSGRSSGRAVGLCS